MYNKLIFFNSFGAGDIYESREFVKEWMKLVPANEYIYAHGKSPKIIKDISNLGYAEVTPTMDSMKDIFELDGDLYVNTWIGRDGQYVLPGIGCTVEELYRMHNDMLRKFNLGSLSGIAMDYIPKIDYSHFNISSVTDFMLQHVEEKIFIDNGFCQSNQAENFDFNPIILRLSGMFTDRLFITTHKVPGDFPNIIYTGDIINSNDGTDLPEVSYLSHFCSCLIGRNSGPHVHTQTYANCFDSKKKLLSFTYMAQGSSFIVNTPVTINKYWSPYTSDNETFERIKEIIV